MESGLSMRVEFQGVTVFIQILIITLLPTVRADVKQMDMAPDAVDDPFPNCRDLMLKAVIESDALLQKELHSNTDFKELWRKHSGVCRKDMSGGTPYHMDALQAYGNSKTEFRKRFNKLVYSKGSNSTTYRDEFPFKSLHFLLTDSLRLRNPKHTCKRVYYGTENQYTALPGAEVRFGKFISAKLTLSSETEVVEEKGEGTVFNITSCSVVNIEETTCNSEEIQCLISPAEVFTVQKVKDVITDDATYKEITLTHSRFLSNQNCTFFHENSAGAESSISLTLTLLTLIISLLSQMTLTA